MANLKAILDTFAANASEYYTDRVPATTKESLTTIGGVIVTDTKIRNEFLDMLVNKVCLQIIETRRYKNPLVNLKKGGSPYGKYIEHIMVNPAIAKTYDYKTTDLFKVDKPDVKATYYKVNRLDQYDVSITKTMLRQALTSDAEMGGLIAVIVNSLYSGDAQDEFILMKNLFTKAIVADHVTKISVFSGDMSNMDAADKKELASNLLENIQLYTDMFTFVSDEYNKYKALVVSSNNYVSPADDVAIAAITPAQTFCPIANQNVIITAFAKNLININVLATVFNLSIIELQQKMIVVDDLGPGVLAILADETFTQVRDVDFSIENFYNPQQRTMKYFLNHDQSLGYCTFANIVAFTYTDVPA